MKFFKTHSGPPRVHTFSIKTYFSDGDKAEMNAVCWLILLPNII